MSRKHTSNPTKSTSESRPKSTASARKALERQFIAAVLKDFRKEGSKAIRLAREKSPVRYLELVSKVIPQQIELEAQGSLADLLEQNAKARHERTVNGEHTTTGPGVEAGERGRGTGAHLQTPQPPNSSQPSSHSSPTYPTHAAATVLLPSSEKKSVWCDVCGKIIRSTWEMHGQDGMVMHKTCRSGK